MNLTELTLRCKIFKTNCFKPTYFSAAETGKSFSYKYIFFLENNKRYLRKVC
jgi:hypothetical protein